MRSRHRNHPEVSSSLTSRPLSGAAEIMPERGLPLANLLVIQLFASVGWEVARAFGKPPWYGAAIGLCLVVPLVVRVRNASIVHRVLQRVHYRYDRRRRMAWTTSPVPFDGRLSDGSPIGFYWDGRVLVSAVRVMADQHAMTVLKPDSMVSGQVIPVGMLADCLQQFGVAIDSIDVIAHGARSSGGGSLAATYEEVLGPLPAIAERSVYVIVRFDPSRCPDVVLRHGGEWAGALRTAATATRRVVHRLSDAGLSAKVMTAAEITHAVGDLTDGIDLNLIDETWDSCRSGRFRTQSFVVDSTMFNSAGLSQLWTARSQSTTMCVSIRREARTGVLALRGLVRFDSFGERRFRLPGLRELRGMQYAALLSALPLPEPPRGLDEWMFGWDDSSLAELTVPAAGCGQLVGADEQGRAIALPLFGPGIRRVELCGTLHLAQQVVLRSLALGARVRVHTHRTGAWRRMAERIGNPSLLRVIDPSRTTTPASVERGYSVVVLDGRTDHSVAADVTTMLVRDTHDEPATDTDVTLQLLTQGADRESVLVRTKSASTVVTMVATEDEMLYLDAALVA